jgi:hypothetical protein
MHPYGFPMHVHPPSYAGPLDVVGSVLDSPWAWLIPIALGVAAYQGKKKHRPALALAAGTAAFVINGMRPPGRIL